MIRFGGLATTRQFEQRCQDRGYPISHGSALLAQSFCTYLVSCMFPQTVLTVGVLTVLDKRGLARYLAPFAVSGDSFLCAGCGNGEGHVAPVYAKWSVAPVYAVKHNDFGRFSLKILSGALGASGWLLGAFWVPLGCFLGASWVSP